MIHIFSVTK